MPLPLAFAGLAGLQLASGYFAAENIKQTAELNRDINNMNAEFALLDAYDAEVEGYSQSAKYQASVDATLGTQQAELAAADIDVNYGSASSIQAETRFIAEVNKMEIIHQAENKSLGYEREARDFQIGGSLAYAKSKGDIFAARLGAVTSAARTGLSGYRRSR